ncbi:hypothetical protein [Sphingomonas oryzagri]|jgi:hypothetical protein|uniref:Uncharacterized protein n=1 Tax=Sphingomonas oryzagri TaxID=3042314 RepID=A0ABT6N4D5_9SPHN|nr:hypothetical protein [Sphingomonas oryzagri]MDH7639947.1 hypothetical protein [Sphingomonas oryzagri]
MIRVWVASIASIITAASAGAQTPTAPAPACELHVWPAERFNARTTGWGVGFGLIGALADSAGHADGDAQRRTSLSSALDSPGQTAALNSLALADLLKQQPATVILHDAPLERHSVNDIKTRRATSSSPCYSELIVADVLYQKAAMYGRSLKTLFIYRQFGDAPEAKRIYKSWGGNGLKIFPPKPGDDIQAANDELVSVFKADFEEFARNEVAAQTATR